MSPTLRPPRLIAAVVLLAALAQTASATTRYVASSAVDGPGCGSKATPCRSISRAIAAAEPGDVILVGPGRYGDLDGDGILDDPGEERPTRPCGCMLSVEKPVVVVSSRGAAETVIDARGVLVAVNVLVSQGGEFGRPGRGFTVTRTAALTGDGLVAGNAPVAVRGNQIVTDRDAPTLAHGIRTLPGEAVLVQGNQVLGSWAVGIGAYGAGTTVRKNEVSVGDHVGIHGRTTSAIVGNVVSACGIGIDLLEGATAIGNAVYGNGDGIRVSGPAARPFTGAIARNDVVGNRRGLVNDGVPGLRATAHY